ncbi:Protein TRIGALACTOSYLDIACYLGLYCEROL 3, chloroplastic [Orobanche minor]
MTIKEASKKLSISLYSSSPSPLVINVVGDLIRSVHMKGEDAIGQPGKIASYVVVTHQHSTIKEEKSFWQGMTHEFSSSTNPIVRQSHGLSST